MLHLIPSHQARPADDPIFALNREATERKKRGESVINATIGALLDDDGVLAVLPTAARAVRSVPTEDWAAYAPISGTPDFLRAAMDELLSTQPALRQCAVGAATPGGTGALRHAIANYLEPGQALLAASFFWGPYQTLADEADRRVVTFSMFAADGNFDVAALDRAVGELAVSQKRVLIFINDPCNNPTGYSMRPEEWRAVTACLAAHAERVPVTLLVDNAYSAYGPGDPTAFLSELVPLLGKATLLFAWSASKTFTHYGLRVGALIACVPDEAARVATASAFSYSSRGTWSNCNRGGQVAITRILTDPELTRACNAERDVLRKLLLSRVDTFNRLALPKGLKYPRYEGGFFVTVFADDAHTKAAKMKDEGIFVVPQKGALRLALCSVRERDVERLVGSLARYANA